MIDIERPTAAGRGQWLTVAIVWTGGLAALVTWLRTTPTGTLREELKVAQFWSLELCVLLGLIAAVWAGASLLRPGPWRRAISMIAAAAIAMALTVFAAPRTNRIFYDEQIYESIGQNLSDLRRAQVCNDGRVDDGRLQCASGEYNKQPYAYPHLLSIAYRLVGVHDWVAFAVNGVVMAATVMAIYALVLVVFADRLAAGFASLAIATMPEQLMWSATAAVEPSASLACVVAVICAAHYSRAGGRAALIAGAVSAAYAIQFRPESILVLPIVALIAWPRLRASLAVPEGWWGAVLFLALTAIPVAHLYAVRNVGWGTDAARFSWRYVATNLPVNGRFYLADERFPVVLTLLALIGLFASAPARGRRAMAAYFALFFAVDLVFYAGSYDYGADVRYSLMTYPPLAVLAGVGGAQGVRWAGRFAPRAPWAAVLAALVCFQFLWYLPVVRATTEEAWAARADVTFARAVARQLPANSFVLTQNPGMFHVWGISAAQMSRVVATPGYAAFLGRQYPGGVYVHWNFWCEVDDPVQPALCGKTMALGGTELIAETRARDHRYAFYRLKIDN